MQLRDKIKDFPVQGRKVNFIIINSAFRQTGKAVISLCRYGGQFLRRRKV